MKAQWKLLSLPMRRTPVGGVLALVIYGLGVLFMLLARQPALVFMVGGGFWVWAMMAGMALRSVLRPETLLLPGFRRQLAWAGVIHGVLGVLLPVALMVMAGDHGHAALTAALLLLAMAVGLSTGLGLRITLVVWLVFIAAGWMPHLTAAVVRAISASVLAPAALALLAVLLLSAALRPLLTVSDREIDDSPMQAVADGRKPAVAADGTPKRRGWVGRQLSPLLDGAAQRTLEAALAAYRRSRTPSARMRVVRAVLLPHDNPTAVLLNLAVVAAFVALYIVATHASQRWHAGFVGGYAVIIGLSRFAAVGAGMLRMRPNLADLYMTLAPETGAEFQATLADTLLWLIGVAVFNCIAYATLVCLLVHAADPARVILAAALTGIGASFGALAAHLVGPESQLGRGLVQFAVMGGAVGVYALAYWLMGRFGLAIGATGTLLVTLPFGLGAWFTARREYLTRPPRFDAPLT